MDPFAPKTAAMMRLLPLTLLILACSTATLASGGVFGCKVDVPDCIGKYCCDDYCGKPLPSTRGVCCFGCNDYCGKPLPSARGVCCFRLQRLPTKNVCRRSPAPNAISPAIPEAAATLKNKRWQSSTVYPPPPPQDETRLGRYHRDSLILQVCAEKSDPGIKLTQWPL